MAISTPAKTQINVVATTFDHSAKSNLGQIRTGSYLTQASMLVYDDILRFQRSSDGYMSDSDINNFNYNQFEGNILWFMDELVGMESDWIQDASPGIEGNTAYGYVQFTEESVETAVNRYIGHLERFNARRNTRDWEPYSIKRGETLPIPEWLITLKNSTKTHKEKLDALTYDEMLALAFVHLHSKDSKDSNFVLLSQGDIYASKELYKNNHHTNPDAATLSRMEDFWPWRKQNKYVEKLAHAKSGTPSKLWIRKHCDADHTRTAAALAGKVVKTADDVIKCLRTKLIVQSGDELAARLANDSSVYVTDVTAQISASDLGVYTNWHQGLKNISGGSNYKVFESEDTYYHPSLIGYYFYRPNGATEWLQNIKDELNTNAIDYNFDELCQTIENWDVNIHTYIVDWWQDNIAGTDVYPGFNFITPPALGVAGVPTGPFNLSGGYRWDNAFINQVVKGPHQFVSQEIIVLSLSVNNPREQLQTIFHEAGGHAMHGGNWGGLHAGGVGDDKFLTQQQNTDLLTLFENYSLEQNEKYYQLAMSLGFPPSTNPVLTTFENRVFTHMPMAYFLALDLYKDFAIEDEFLARVYAMMAVNKCITFENDIWPVMKRVSPEIVGIGPHSTPIIDLALAREIDLEMKNKMKLDMRTY